MKHIGEQRTRATGAREPFTPVRTRLELDEERDRFRRQYRMYQRMNTALVIVMGATLIIAFFAVIYHVTRVI